MLRRMLSQTEDRPSDLVDAGDDPLPLLHVVQTISRYRFAIGLSLATVLIGYGIIATGMVLWTPAERSTALRFRLNFDGASEGRYPNGQKFNPLEIVSTWILNDVYRENDLGRITTPDAFAHAVVVIEANPEYEQAAADYQRRLADSRLTPIDRDRIAREWDAKRGSFNNSDYELSFTRLGTLRQIPEATVRKVLVDILSTWARIAANEHHILDYPVSVLSPSFVATSASDPQEIILAAQFLRGKIRHVLSNVRDLEDIPGSELVRSSGHHVSLQEIRVRLEEAVRFRLDPLVRTIHAGGPVEHPEQVLRFAEAQLDYDRNQLKVQETNIASVREALAMYSSQNRSQTPPVERGSGANPEPSNRSAPSETLMPQLGDSFLDRLTELTRASTGMVYREKLVEEYRRLARNLAPAQEAVTYDEQFLVTVRGPGRTGTPATAAAAELEGIRSDMATMIGEIGQIYTTLSNNRTPVTELFTITGPVVTRSVRAIDLRTLGFFGVLIVVIFLPIMLVAVLLHARLRAETRPRLAMAHGAR
jgi:hypothetical protein